MLQENALQTLHPQTHVLHQLQASNTLAVCQTNIHYKYAVKDNH